MTPSWERREKRCRKNNGGGVGVTVGGGVVGGGSDLERRMKSLLYLR